MPCSIDTCRAVAVARAACDPAQRHVFCLKTRVVVLYGYFDCVACKYCTSQDQRVRESTQITHLTVHYYQPGIGTYVETSSLSRKSRIGRIRSWYVKAKDQAIGTSFGEHGMAGYKFLMRYYNAGDDIYFFGFSRGSYTARFLAQMLDYMGLLSAGNEEMLRFAWKTFAQWQMRTEGSEKERKAKNEQFHFMKKFRDTFSRYVVVIPRDCSRIAQANRDVSIDERRAKFRQDLIGANRPEVDAKHRERHIHRHRHDDNDDEHDEKSKAEHGPALMRRQTDHMFRRKEPRHADPNLHATPAISSAASQISVNSTTVAKELTHGDASNDDNLDLGPLSENDATQDILEVWFAGNGHCCHNSRILANSDGRSAWRHRRRLATGEKARLAGLPFDEDKLEASGLLVGDVARQADAPLLRLDGMPLPRTNSIETAPMINTEEDWALLETKTKLHDSLAFGGGLSWTAVLAWQMMEWLPLRRMDLQPGGDWAPISWPLPRGETRDMPNDAIIHGSVIKRMQVDSNYRPGNLIIGGGGRGVRRAPESAGIGHWQACREEGHRVGEAMRRAAVNGSS
nr:uncharacterized protein CFP56_07579 [Quercus suber]